MLSSEAHETCQGHCTSSLDLQTSACLDFDASLQHAILVARPISSAVVDSIFPCQACIIICGRRMWRNVASSSTWQRSRFLPVSLKSSRTETVGSTVAVEKSCRVLRGFLEFVQGAKEDCRPGPAQLASSQCSSQCFLSSKKGHASLFLCVRWYKTGRLLRCCRNRKVPPRHAGADGRGLS